MTRPPAARPRRRALAPGIALALTCACARPPADTTAGDATTTATTGDDASASDTDPPPTSPTPAANCGGAPEVTHGRLQGSLRGVAVEPDGACGEPGPTTYLRVVTDLHVDLQIAVQSVGFAPRVEIAADECLLGLAVACGQDGVVALGDALPGSAWLVRIGAAADDPALDLPAPEDGSPDPLAFTVDVGRTLVLDPGDVCSGGDEARCPAGTLCAATDDPGDEPGLGTCAPLDGDTCESAEVLVLSTLAGAFEVDRSAPQTDAHAHSCAGAGTRERVLRAVLDADFPADAQLVFFTKTPDVDLAVRTPGCDLEDEVACEVGGAGGLSVVVDDPAALAAAGQSPWIFVEWPGDAVGPAALEWTVEVP